MKQEGATRGRLKIDRITTLRIMLTGKGNDHDNWQIEVVIADATSTQLKLK